MAGAALCLSVGMQAAVGVAQGSPRPVTQAAAHSAGSPVRGSSRQPVGTAPAIPAGAKKVSGLPSATPLKVDVVLKPSNPSGLAAYASGVSDPASPSYRHFLGRGQFASLFGPSSQTVHDVVAALQAEGLHPGRISADHLTIPVRATAAALAKGLSTGFSEYRLKSGRVAYANTSAPELPSDVATQVVDVAGLDDLVEPQAGAVRVNLSHKATGSSLHAPLSPQVVTGGPQPCTAASSHSSTAYTADEIASAYGLSDLYGQGDEGQGQTIAVLEAEPNLSSDITAYQSCYGTSTSVRYVEVDGGPGSSGAGSGETALDIEQIIGLAPEAQIVVYQTNPTLDSLYDGFVAAISSDTAQVISTSWGTCEAFATELAGLFGGPTLSGMFDAENTLFEEAAVQGQSVVAASGDAGSEECAPWASYDKGFNSELHVQDPSAQPFVTAVGGTTLAQPGAPSSETVWNSYFAGGGGISEQWPMPAYQADAPSGLGVTNPYSSGAPCRTALGDCREVPDVAADADPYTGYAIYWNGSWYGFGGTSAAAPLWAALLALTDASSACAGSPIGFANPALYSVAATDPGALTDITVGNNDMTRSDGGTYPARAGYDMASGLGTPTANLPGALCTYRAPDPVQFTSPASALLDLGSPGSFTVTTSGLPAPAVTETGALPTGVTFADDGGGTATISGTPAQTGTFPVTLTASNGAAIQSQSFTLVVGAPPAITSQAAATFTAGTSGSFQMSATGTPVPSFTVTGGTLPSGLQLTSTGKLVGAPGPTAGTYIVKVEASNGVAPASVQQLVLTVDGAPAFTSPVIATFVVGKASTFTIATSAAPVPTLLSSPLPSWLSFTDNGDGTARLSGTPTTTGSTALTIGATNSFGSSSQVVDVDVVGAPSAPVFTSAPSATFSEGKSQTFLFTAKGIPAPTFVLMSGNLPLTSGQPPVEMTMSSGGSLSGFVAWGTGGSYHVVVEAYNGVGPGALVDFTLTVQSSPELFPISYDGAFVAASNQGPGGDLVLGQPGQMHLRSTGYPTPVFTQSGGLPPGTTFTDDGDGAATLAGTPTQSGEYDVTVQVSNAASTVSTLIVLFVAPASPPRFLTPDHGTVATDGPWPCGSFTVTASGFPVPKIIETGALPSPVSVDVSSTSESWYPGTADIGLACPSSASTGPSGIYPLVFSAANSAGSAIQDFALTLAANQVTAPSFISAPSADFVTGVYNAFQFQASSPQGSPSCFPGTTSPLPQGIFRDPAGMLYGIPAPGTEGTYPLTVVCAYNFGNPPQGNTVTQSFILSVTDPGPPTVTSAPDTTFAANLPNTFTVRSTGWPIGALSVGGPLPAGVSFADNGDGTATLSGTPTQTGTFPLTISCANSFGTTTQGFSLSVTSPQAPAFASPPTAVFTTSDTTSFPLSASGAPPPTFALASGSLPPGLTLSSDGVISGRAGNGGDYPIVVSASNGVPPDATQSLDVVADEPPAFVLSNPTSATYTGAAPLSVTVSATGYPLTFAASGLPAGTTIVQNGLVAGTHDEWTATISGMPAGTPGATVSYPVAVSVSNPEATSTTTLSLIVTLPPLSAVTTVTPASGTASGGTKVTIAGSNFAHASAVMFGTRAATSFTVNSTGTSIVAYAPAEAAGAVPVTVTTPSGAGTSSASFTFLAPSISSISPVSGTAAGGTKVVIKGAELQKASSVMFGTKAASSFTVNSYGTAITAYTPAEPAGPVPVVVTTPGGTATAPASFAFLAATVTSMSPTSGSMYGGTKVTLKGTNLKTATSVRFGTAAATSFTVNSYGTAITAYAPSEPAGTVTVTVTTAAGTAGAPVPFTFGPPVISSISPTSGTTAGGTIVYLEGTFLQGASSVLFGATAATRFSVNSAGTKITAYSPAEPAGSVTVSVKVPGVTLVAPTQFRYS